MTVTDATPSWLDVRLMATYFSARADVLSSWYSSVPMTLRIRQCEHLKLILMRRPFHSERLALLLIVSSIVVAVVVAVVVFVVVVFVVVVFARF